MGESGCAFRFCRGSIRRVEFLSSEDSVSGLYPCLRRNEERVAGRAADARHRVKRSTIYYLPLWVKLNERKRIPPGVQHCRHEKLSITIETMDNACIYEANRGAKKKISIKLEMTQVSFRCTRGSMSVAPDITRGAVLEPKT